MIAVIGMCPRSLLGISLHGDAFFFPPQNEISIFIGDFLAHQDLLYILTFFTMPLSDHLAVDHEANLYQDVNEMVGRPI